MLGAMGMMPQYAGTASNLAQANPLLALQSAGIRSGAAGLMPGLANAYGNYQGIANSGALGVLNAMPGYTNAYGNVYQGMGQGYTGVGQGMLGQGAGFAGLGQADQQLGFQNIQNMWNAWQQTQGPSGYGTAALGFGTNFPPVSNQPSTGSSIAGMLGGIGGALLGAASTPWWLSDRNAKEDIVELQPGEALSKLRRLPLSTWRYKGDSQRHIGPMAQDWQETFNVGDGKSLALPDMLGVMMASIKDLAYGTR